MNKRTDHWGGSLENKFRIIERIFIETRKNVGDFPILVKLNAYDTRKKGMRISEAVAIAKLLEQVGCAAIEVSCGVVNDGFITVRSEKFPTEAALEYSYLLSYLPRFVKWIIRPFIPLTTELIVPLPKELSLYNVEAAEIIKRNVSIPVIVVGGIKRLADIEEIIANNRADYISMSRAFIIEPERLEDERGFFELRLLTTIGTMSPFGVASSYQKTPAGIVYFDGFKSIDSALIFAGLNLGLVAMVIGLVGLAAAIVVVLLRRATPATIAAPVSFCSWPSRISSSRWVASS